MTKDLVPGREMLPELRDQAELDLEWSEYGRNLNWSAGAWCVISWIACAAAVIARIWWVR